MEAESRRSRPGDDPFKDGLPTPFLHLPHAGPEVILVDVAHSFHIKGVGVDFAASVIVLGCRKNLWGTGAFDAKLEQAYNQFLEFCTASKRSTTCGMWSMLKLDMSSGNDFPTSLDGKGMDTAVVSAWLEDTLSKQASG